VGISVELKQVAGQGAVAIVGIGMNVNRPDVTAFEGAAYLGDGAAAPVSREDVTAAVIDGLLETYGAWCAAACSFAPFVARYHEHMWLVGEQVCVRDAMGAELAAGLVQGIDDAGRLMVKGPQGLSAVFAGEVTLREVCPVPLSCRILRLST
jgi:biotin-(acetyl-CoA carboxylase) ligase